MKVANQKTLVTLFSIIISFLGVALLTYSATTISTNINTGGDFIVGNSSGYLGIGTTTPIGTLQQQPVL